MSLWAHSQQGKKNLCIIESLCYALEQPRAQFIEKQFISPSLKFFPCDLHILLLKMYAYMKREQEKGTPLRSPLPCVRNMVPSMTLFLQLEIPTCYLILRTEQLHICLCNTWAWEQGKLFLFSCSSWGGAGLGKAACAVQLENWTHLCRGASDPKRGPVSSSCHLQCLCLCLLRVWERTRLLCELMTGTSHVTGEGQGEGCVSVQRGGWGWALGWGCCAGLPWAGCLPFSGNSLAFYFGRLIPAWFLSAGWFFTHIVNRHELAEIKNFCRTIAELFSCWWQNACSWWHYQQSSGSISSRALPPAGLTVGANILSLNASKFWEGKLHWNASNPLAKPSALVFKLKFRSTPNPATPLGSEAVFSLQLGEAVWFFPSGTLLYASNTKS